jgi:sec-independent protein translocase protein TatA
MGLGGTELLVIVFIVLLLFGAKKIPELASGLGSGIKNFKKALNDDEQKPTQQNSNIDNNNQPINTTATTNTTTTSTTANTHNIDINDIKKPS